MITTSIIIPCYNHGAYLLEALQSIELINSPYKYEVLIINDGSTEESTLKILGEAESKGYKVVHQANQGLAAARNNGIAIAIGKYIIPLDSDNRLHRNYLTKAIDILEQDAATDIVYGNPVYFGDRQGTKKVGTFELGNLLYVNYIDACAVFRKDVWKKVGGYDGQMPAMGNEDWEFWIHAFLAGAKFHYLDATCFYYRVLGSSMSATTTRPKYVQNKEYIYQKHFTKLIPVLVQEQKMLDYIRGNRLKVIAKLIMGYKFKNDFSNHSEL